MQWATRTFRTRPVTPRSRRDGSEASGVISLGPTVVRLRERLSETGA